MTKALTFSLLLLASLPAVAHDFWIEPTALAPAPGTQVGIRLRVGEHFVGDPVPRNPERIERFAILGPNGEKPVPGVSGGEPAGYATVGPAGIYQIVYDSNRATLGLEPKKFEEYLRMEGLERILDLSKKRGLSEKPSREVYSRCAKALLAVGGTSGAGFDKPVGLDLELIAEKNPFELAPGADLPFRLLYSGRPLPGALVFALPHSRPEAGALKARSDAEGRVRFKLPAGPSGAEIWLIKAVHMIEAPKDAKDADWETFWASLVFRAGK
jgi:uncharacterized GH25 family protein